METVVIKKLESVELVKQLESFKFDDTEIQLTKIKNLRKAIKFKDETLPIIIGQLKPLEVFFAAVVNEFAPLRDWGILDSMIASEKDIDKCLVPAFRVMLDYYLSNSEYSDEQLDRKIFDLELLYAIVMSQMKIEHLLEYHLRRKLSFIMDVSEFAKLGINFDSVASKAESTIKAALSKTRVDKDITG